MKTLLTISISISLLSLATITGLRADDQKPPATSGTAAADSGQCDHSCHMGGCMTHEGDKASAATPAPSPAK